MIGRTRRAVADGGRAAAHGGRAAADDGSAALELVILAPVLFALLGLVIAAGRISIAQSSVNAAARDAARQASISLTPAAAEASGQASALTALRLDGLDCKPVILINVSQFATTEPGEPAAVTATVKCAISLSDLAMPGLPGSTMLQSHFTSPLDVFRSR